MKCFALALAACCLLVSVATAAEDKAVDKWVEQKGVELLTERQADGDSFGMTVESAKGKRVKRTYRLYGVDCPESDAKDKFVADRIQQQAEYFGCKPEEIPGLGKDAAVFTDKLLKNGKPQVLTRGKMGQKVQKVTGRPQRYFALIEVTAPDGSRRWLHELLLEAGLARAHGIAAAWPPKQEDWHGKAEAETKFMKDLSRLEHAAKKEGLGVWRNRRAPHEKFR